MYYAWVFARVGKKEYDYLPLSRSLLAGFDRAGVRFNLYIGGKRMKSVAPSYLIQYVVPSSRPRDYTVFKKIIARGNKLLDVVVGPMVI